MDFWTWFLLCIGLWICSAEKVSYEGYSLIQIQITDPADISWIQLFADEGMKADIWSYPTKTHPQMDILVSPAVMPEFTQMLTDNNLDYRIIIENIENAIEESEANSGIAKRPRRHISGRPRPRPGPHNFPVDDYHTFEEIETWLLEKNSTHSNKMRLISLGKTNEGRDIWMVKISNHQSRRASKIKKPAIFIDAGIHAREWISQATALFIIKELLHHDSNSVMTNEFSALRRVDWYIVPVANPDGYAYSISTNRLWRKSRSDYSRKRSNSNSLCRGVDINRNFDHHWGEAGASTSNRCSNIYAGPHAFSEPETEALASKLRELASSLKVYISLHSYGQLWLAPWGYNSRKPANYAQQSAIAEKAIEALKRINQTEYTFGTIADLMYPASGTSVDYAHSLGIPFSYALELRPEDSDKTAGFLYPAKYILPTGKETFEALKVIAREISQSR